MLKPLLHWMESQGAWTPWLFLALFLVASFLMIWRLEAMSAGRFELFLERTYVRPVRAKNPERHLLIAALLLFVFSITVFSFKKENKR